MNVPELFRDFPELGPSAGKGICLPLAPRIAKTERLAQVLDTWAVQRLRGVRQLAFAHLIYPGATHTRLEHVLGVYHRVGRYILILSANEHFTTFASKIRKEHIASLLLAALLHDSGHYPFAHSFEELAPSREEGQSKHEDLAVSLLSGKLGAQDKESHETLVKAIKAWGVGPADVATVIVGRPEPGTVIEPEFIGLLHSILDGPLDADKLDYLQRDSLHTGNPAGMGIDEERFVSSLVVESLSDGLGIRERGLAAVQSLFQARFSMFLTVYWHRTNRAMTRMFTEAARLLHTANPKALAEIWQNDIFRRDDEAVLRSIADALPATISTSLINPLQAAGSGRSRIYRRLVTISAREAEIQTTRQGCAEDDPHCMICSMFDDSIRGLDLRWKWELYQEYVRKAIHNLSAGASKEHEVLLDVPDPRFEQPVHTHGLEPFAGVKSSFNVYDQAGLKTSISERMPLIQYFIAVWRRNARKARLYLAPDLYARMTSFRDVTKEKMVAMAVSLYHAKTRGDAQASLQALLPKRA